MPRFNINTYQTVAGKYRVNKIISEVKNVQNLTKSVTVGEKFSNKQSLSFKNCFKSTTNNELTQGTERC